MKKHKHKFTIGSLNQDLSTYSKSLNDFDFAYMICPDCGEVKRVRIDKKNL